ncbi:MAG: hypothetical protein J3K34DRAFT_491425 [Monoraphidium minutum]|nr:MAG: hypothetical protein J3K34DRAFT_491425 [Monoraphidium minutum]
MSLLMLRSLLRAGRLPSRSGGLAGAAQQQARLLSASAAGNGANGSDGDEEPIELGFDAARQGLPVRVHQLIGDPRTGVADDTTQPLHGDLAAEWIWHQQTNETYWYRYSLAGPDQLPHMHVDARLWTIEALASKFRVRRQRVLAILALKEVEAQGMEDGRLMAGPFSPFAFRVVLDDVFTDALGEPLDLGDVVHSEGPAPAAAAGAAAAADAARRRRGPGGGGGGGAAAGEDLLGSLSDFVDAGGAAEAGASGSGGGGAAGGDALTSLQRAAGGQRHDLARVAPAVGAAAQRAHLQLLAQLRRLSYSPGELRRQLLAQVDAAEAAWAELVAGTPLEDALIAAARELEAAAAPAAAQQQEQAAGEEQEQQQQQEDGGGGEGKAAAAAAGLPRCVDFAWQRSQVEALVAAVGPLMAAAGEAGEREAAVLAAALREELRQLESQPPQAEQQQQEGQPPGGDAGAALRALVDGAPPRALAGAFNLLDQAARRALLAAAPAARAALNVRGADLKAAVSGDAPFSPSGAAVSAIGGGGAAAGAAGIEQLPEWPGQVPALVDAFGYADIPSGALDAALAALTPLEVAAAALEALLAAAAGGEGAGIEAGAGAGGGDVRALREATAAYCTLGWAYDKVLDAQTAEVAGVDDPPPPPPPNAQRRLMRILRELDPRALEKLLYWESYERELKEDPVRARGLRTKIQAVLQRMGDAAAAGGIGGAPAAEGGEGEEGEASAAGGGGGEYPELGTLKDPRRDLSRRLSHDLVAAFLDAAVVGRQYHRGSGERHFVREGELSLLTRRAAEAEDDIMWREFRERIMYNLGLAGAGLWDTHGHARPQRPEAGWSWVVHDTSRAWNSKRERRRGRAAAAAGAPPAPPAPPGAGGPVPYVAEAGGGLRGMGEEEVFLQRRRAPKERRRWFAHNRRLGTG